MTREIKFRFWNDTEKKMYYPDVLETPLIKPIGIKDCWLQYTGLKDKSGKEIYEGDVLKITKEIEDNGFIYKAGQMAMVEWHHAGFIYNFINIMPDRKIWPFFEGFAVEIIGNIYENPELLK